jgi:hypothetical protein
MKYYARFEKEIIFHSGAAITRVLFPRFSHVAKEIL